MIILSEQNKALVRRMFEEVWNERNLDVLDEICAPDYYGVGPYGDERGPDGVKQGVTSRVAAFPDVHATIEDMIAEGDKVVCRVTFCGTHRGEFRGIAPSDKEVTWTGIWIYRVANGKLIERWHNWDLLGLLQQIGAPEVRP